MGNTVSRIKKYIAPMKSLLGIALVGTCFTWGAYEIKTSTYIYDPAIKESKNILNHLIKLNERNKKIMENALPIPFNPDATAFWDRG